MKRKFIAHIKEYWKTNLIVFLSLLSLSILFFYFQKQEMSMAWFIQTIFIPFFISCAANISTSRMEREKISFFQKRDMDMNRACSEIIGFLKGSKNKSKNEKDYRHLLSLAKKLQMSISSQEQE